MRSARPRHRHARLAALALAALFLAGVPSGCATTQETAAEKRAESTRILERREERRKQKSKSHDDGREQR